MYKEFRFEDPAKALQKRKQLKQEFGYDFPLYKIQLEKKEFMSVVYPYGLQPKEGWMPNQKRKR